MKIFLGVLFEYFLSFKTFIFNFLPKPKDWEVGNKGTFVFIPGFMDTWGPYKKLGNSLNKNGYKKPTTLRPWVLYYNSNVCDIRYFRFITRAYARCFRCNVIK